jgi:hypothetical protein
MTTGSRDLDRAGDALKGMLGDEPSSPVLGRVRKRERR